MSNPIVWMLTFTFLGSNPPQGGEQAKFKTKEECVVALEQKREQYKKDGIKVAGACVMSDKKSGV